MKEILFTKEELLKSKMFQDKRDVLKVILKDEKTYSIKQTEKMIINFLKKEVK